MNTAKLLLLALLAAMPAGLLAEAPAVQIEPPLSRGTRMLKKQTAEAAVRDYLQAWGSLSNALEQNRAELLEQNFVGIALDKFKSTVQQQALIGVHARYQDRAHDLQVIFYSPDGLSIELLDNVVYDQQVFDHDKALGADSIRGRYVVVLTPSEVRWRVRVMQAEPDLADGTAAAASK